MNRVSTVISGFGERWCKRLLPQQLKELMRHEDLDTTMRYYVGDQAAATATAVWAAYRESQPMGATLGATRHSEASGSVTNTVKRKLGC